MIGVDGKVRTHQQTTAEKLNNYYISLADNITDNNPINNNNGDLNKINPLNHLYSVFKQSFTNTKMKNTTTYEIKKNIEELKSKKLCGYDEIMTKILKISSLFIVSPLTYICNRMLLTGTFPDRLKFSEIKPIYKSGDKAFITNYRPITLLPIFSKSFEKVIYKRLYYHLTSNDIFVKEQFGFRCNNSTEIATYTLLNYIFSHLHKKIIVGGLFCDL